MNEIGGKAAGIAMFIGYWLIAILQVAAFTEGLQVWWGWSFFPAFLVWLVCAALGPLGAVPLVIVTFIGAHSGFGWAWWQAALLAAPTLIFMAANLLFNGARSGLARRY